MSTFHHWQPGEGFGKDISENVTGVTNDNGIVTISGRALRGYFSYGVREVPGFYAGGGGKFEFKEKANDQWKPWNSSVGIVIKPIVNPIPMYARRIGGGKPFKLPKAGVPIGFKPSRLLLSLAVR